LAEPKVGKTVVHLVEMMVAMKAELKVGLKAGLKAVPMDATRVGRLVVYWAEK
jgi:hypothetical protein